MVLNLDQCLQKRELPFLKFWCALVVVNHLIETSTQKRTLLYEHLTPPLESGPGIGIVTQNPTYGG